MQARLDAGGGLRLYATMRIIGLDPGLRVTGWGIIDQTGNRLTPIAHGTVKTTASLPLAQRLVQLEKGLVKVIAEYGPDEAAVEETFVNQNPTSTLKLGMARGVVLLAPASLGLPVGEYPPNRVKKAVVGAGKAAKEQVQMMVRRLLPGVNVTSADEADALAIAICHAHYAEADRRLAVSKVSA